MPIKPDEAVRSYIHTHYKLSEYSSLNESGLGNIMRLFDLKVGESVKLNGIEGDDYIFITTGKIIISGKKCNKSFLVANKQHPKPFLIPEDSGLITIEADKDSLFYHIDSKKLDYLLAWNELGLLLSVSDEFLKHRMDVIINSLPFSQLGIGNVKEALSRMHEVKVKAGTNVINESEPGKAYYIIAEGEAEVWQTTEEVNPVLIASLKKGDGFGDEGVVTGTHVNTVKMTTDGLLYALDKADFDELLSTKMIQTENAEVANTMMNNGYKLLDVRYDFELELYGKIEPSMHIPLHELRERYTEIDPEERYVVYCKSGNRSQVGCLLLEQRGIDAISLNGGISAWPYEVSDS